MKDFTTIIMSSGRKKARDNEDYYAKSDETV